MGAGQIHIEAMGDRDVEEVCVLWLSISELGVSPTFDTPARIGGYLKRNADLSSVARQGERIVGAVMCGHDGWRGSFYHAGVLPEFRGRGVGKRMVERSLAALRDAGITTAFLFTHEKNLAAKAFWQRIGWERCPGVEYHFRDLEG